MNLPICTQWKHVKRVSLDFPRFPRLLCLVDVKFSHSLILFRYLSFSLTLLLLSLSHLRLSAEGEGILDTLSENGLLRVQTSPFHVKTLQ